MRLLNPHQRSDRRHFLARTGVLTMLGACGVPAICAAAPAHGEMSIADAFDREMTRFMAERKVPGGALAVVKDQRLVYAQGYGWADQEQEQRVVPGSLFRIASISKPFTAAAILKLVEAGQLDLNARILELLSLEPTSARGKDCDARLSQVTVRQCLHHTGGWDRGISGDPMFRSVQIAEAVGQPAPASQQAIIRYMLGEPLDFAPGERYAYSNFGYCLLGRVIEKISGKPYHAFVQSALLDSMGIRGMRLGASLEAGRAPGEVRYYTPGDRKSASVFPEMKEQVLAPYGSFCLEAMDSHGGWIASVLDLARFAAALDAPVANCFKPEVRKTFYEAPAAPVSRKADGSLDDAFYGCGWSVRPIGSGSKANYWHNGSLPGTFTLLVRRFDGLSWVALFNQRSENAALPDGAIDSALHRAADSVKDWPARDLFEQG